MLVCKLHCIAKTAFDATNTHLASKARGDKNFDAHSLRVQSACHAELGCWRIDAEFIPTKIRMTANERKHRSHNAPL